MSDEQLKAFLEKVKGDTSLQEKLKAAGDADAVVAIAKAAGFLISADDLKQAQAEVSDEELEGVTGGTAGTNFLLCGGAVIYSACAGWNQCKRVGDKALDVSARVGIKVAKLAANLEKEV